MGVKAPVMLSRLQREIWKHIVKTDVFVLITRLLLHFSLSLSVEVLRPPLFDVTQSEESVEAREMGCHKLNIVDVRGFGIPCR